MNLRQFLFFGYLLLFLVSCDCDDHELLINEVPSSLFFVSEIKQVSPYLSIRFNRNLESSSVILNESLTLTENSNTYNGTFMVDSNTIFIPLCELMCMDTSLCTYEVLLANITTLDGQILDGNMDGNDGGLFVDTLEVTPTNLMDFYIGDFPIFCLGEQSIIDPGPFQSYDWSTGDTSRIISVLDPGNYSVTLSDSNGCTSVASANVIAIPDMDFSAGRDFSICPEQGIVSQLMAVNGCQYMWTPSLGLSDTTIQNPIASHPSRIKYFVTTTFADGTEAIDSVVVDVQCM